MKGNKNFFDLLEKEKKYPKKDEYISIGVLQTPLYIRNKKIPEGTAFKIYHTSLRENLEIFSFEDESQLNSKINTRSTFYKGATN